MGKSAKTALEEVKDLLGKPRTTRALLVSDRNRVCSRYWKSNTDRLFFPNLDERASLVGNV